MTKRFLATIAPLRRSAAIAVFATAALAAVAPAASAGSSPIGAYTNQGTWHFVSSPRLRPPQLSADLVPKNLKRLAHGYFLLANFKELGVKAKMIGQGGPMIFDRFLQPVWYLPRGVNVFVNNLSQHTYNGKPVLSWWEGVVNAGGVVSSGTDTIVDQHYRRIATLASPSGWTISFHELQISGHYAYVTAYRTVRPVDLTLYGGSATGTLLDSGVLQFDLTQGGALVRAWSVYQDFKVPLGQVHGPAPANPGTAWDAYHLNSVQVLGPSEFLISLRNTWGVYLVNNGAIAWTLGGRGSTFTFGHGAAFEWQHDAQLHGTSTLSVFDDACCQLLSHGLGHASGPARGLVLKLDLTSHKASLVRQYRHPGQDVFTAAQGNTQLLAGVGALVDWGGSASFTEYDHNGKPLLDSVLPSPDDTYRAYLTNWVGLPPVSSLRATARRHRGSWTVYASWNGATQVTAWRVKAGSDGKHLRAVAKVQKSGFETSVAAPSAKFYVVQALDSRGRVLGTSKVF